MIYGVCGVFLSFYPGTDTVLLSAVLLRLTVKEAMSSRIAQLALLGLGVDADVATIKSRYRELAKARHPDVNPSSDSSEDFRQLTDAYRALLQEPTDKLSASSGQGPAMEARWRVRRKHKASEVARLPSCCEPRSCSLTCANRLQAVACTNRLHAEIEMSISHLNAVSGVVSPSW